MAMRDDIAQGFPAVVAVSAKAANWMEMDGQMEAARAIHNGWKWMD